MKTNKFLYIDKIIALEKQLEFSDNRLILLEELARLYYKAGEYFRSIKCFKELDTEENRLSFVNYEVYATALTRIGDIEGAAEIILKNKHLKTESPDFLCDLAIIESIRGDNKKTSNYISQAVELFGNHPSVMITKAESAYFLGRQAEGRELFLEFFNYVGPEEVNRLVIIVARFCVSINCYDDARLFLQKSEYIRNHRYYFELATVAISLKLYSKALVYLEHYLKQEPENSYAFFLQGLCLSNLGSRSDDALESFQKSVSLVPYNYVFNYFLSLEYITMQKYDVAVRILEKIYNEDLFIRDEDYAYALGMSQFLSGEHKKSLECFKKASKIFPHNNEIMKGYIKIMGILNETPADIITLYDTLISNSQRRADLVDINFEDIIEWMESADCKITQDICYEDTIREGKKFMKEKRLLAALQQFFCAKQISPRGIAPAYYISKISYTLHNLNTAYTYIELAYKCDNRNFYILYLYYKIMHMKLLPVPKFLYQNLIDSGEKEGITAIKESEWEEAYRVYTRLFDISRSPKYFYYYLEALNQLGEIKQLQGEIEENLKNVDFSEFPQIKETIMEFTRIETQ